MLDLCVSVGLLLLLIIVSRRSRKESHDSKVVNLINELREHEGATVEIACDNPEPQTRQDYACVSVTDDWTNWNSRSFYGESVLDCLQKAKFAKWAIENPDPVTLEFENGSTITCGGPKQGGKSCAVYSHPDCTYRYCPHPENCKVVEDGCIAMKGAK